MGYDLKYDDVTDTGSFLSGQFSQWGSQLQAVEKSTQAVAGQEFAGKTADSIRAYLTEVHAMLLAGIQELLAQYQDQYLLYQNGHYAQLDGDLHAELCEGTFDEVRQLFAGAQATLSVRSGDLAAAIGAVSDIFSGRIPSSDALNEDFDAVYASAADLQNRTGVYEQEHQNDLAAFDALLHSLNDIVQQLLGQPEGTCLRYTSGDVQSLGGFDLLAAAFMQSYELRERLAPQLQDAAQAQDARNRALIAEMAKKREEQGFWDAVVAVTVIVGGALCIVATAGAATPLVVAGAAFAAGSIAYGASNLVEAGENIAYGAAGDPFTAAWNPLRDTVFAGNQQAYDVFGTISMIGAGAVSIGAGAASAASIASKAGYSGARAAGVYLGKTAVSVGTGYGADTLGTKYVSPQFGLAAGLGAGVLVGGGLEALDQRKWNLSGYYTDKMMVYSKNALPNGRPDWSSVQHDGFVLNPDGTPDYKVTTLKQGDSFDRYGLEQGNFVSPVTKEGSYSYPQRSLPYRYNPYAYHRYEVVRDFDELAGQIKSLPLGKLRDDVMHDLSDSGIKVDDVSTVCEGRIAKGFLDDSEHEQLGGGIQQKLTLSIGNLKQLGFIKETTNRQYLHASTVSGIVNENNVLTPNKERNER